MILTAAHDKSAQRGPFAAWVLGAFLTLSLSGCTYHAPLRNSRLADRKAFAGNGKTTITVSNQTDEVSDISYTFYSITVNYDSKDAYLSAIKTTLESVYGHVDVGPRMTATSTLFVVPYLRVTNLTKTPSSPRFDLVSKIDVLDRPGGKPLRSYQSIRHLYYKRSAATVALDYFTAFFFPINLVAMPIAIPIEAQIEGNNGRDGIERAIHHALSTIETQLAQDDERDKDATEIQACFHAAALDPSLTSLSGLVALDDVRNQTSDMLASTKMPTEQERSAIKEWKDLIAPCYAQQEAFLNQWDVPPAIKALIGETKVASLNLRVLLYSGKLTYGEYALKREKVQDAFLTAEAKIEAELLERSEEAEARANTLAVQAQPSNSTALQSRQTVNQAIANNQQQQQTRELTKQLSRPQFTSCEFYSRYSVSCMSW